MKKLFTLIAALVCAVCVNAAKEVDIDLSQNWGWGWSATANYDSGTGILTGNITGEYGAISTGWDPAADWTKYGKLTVVIESYNNDWGQVIFQLDNDNTVKKSFGTITSTTSVTVDIDPSLSWITTVKQLSIQGKAANDVIKISRVYLTEAIEYETTGKSITFDEWGNINASEFDGYSDDAKVVFTYNTTGDLVNDKNESVVGWGTGRISSIDGKVKVADVPVKALGDNEISFTLAELKDALASGPDSYDRYGLYWNMYAQGKSTSTRKSVMIYEVKSSDPTAISNTLAPAKAENNVRYNLLGVKNGNGVYIMNGKKFLK